MVPFALVDVYGKKLSHNARFILWHLLKQRTPETSISHRKVPSWEEHLKFVYSHPYEAWYLIESFGTPVGAIYLTRREEIGIFLFKEHRGYGHGKNAVKELMGRHGPRRYLANINPSNGQSTRFFQSLGFSLLQNTFVYDPQPVNEVQTETQAQAGVCVGTISPQQYYGEAHNEPR